MKRFITIIINICIIFILCSCSNKEYKTIKFVGESDNWYAEYYVNIYNLNDSNNVDKNTKWGVKREIKLKYKNDDNDINKIIYIDYSLKSNSYGSKGKVNYSTMKKNGIITLSNDSKNIAYETKEDIIDLTINWNSNKEDLTLNSNK